MWLRHASDEKQKNKQKNKSVSSKNIPIFLWFADSYKNKIFIYKLGKLDGNTT